MSGAVNWVGENVFGQKKHQQEDPNQARNDINPNTGEYGGQGGRWEPVPDGTPGAQMHDFGGGVSAPARWVPSVGDQTAQKYNDIGAQYRGGADADYMNAEMDRRRGLEARGGQQDVFNMALARAKGQVPSIAEQQAQRDAGRLVADQSSIAAGARGPAALALAQQQNANNSATGVSNISQNAQINAATERERAEQAAYGMATGMRQGDQSAFGANSGQAGQKGQLGLGYSGLENSVRQSQQQGSTNREALRTGQYNAAQSRNMQGTDANNNSNMTVASGILGMATSGAGALSDERAKRGINPLGMSDFIGRDAPPTATWGVGSGMGPTQAEEYLQRNVNEANAEEARQKQLESDYQAGKAQAHAALNMGPMAVAGVNGPGQFVQPDNALQRRDDERRMELRGRREHGIDLTDNEATEERVLNRRAGEEKAADKGKPEQAQKRAEEKKSGFSSLMGGLADQFNSMSKEGQRRMNGGAGYASFQPQLIGQPSDEAAKTQIMPLGIAGAQGNGTAWEDRSTAPVMDNATGGVNVMGTYKQWADMGKAAHFGGPGGVSVGGKITSDMSAKEGIGFPSDMYAKDGIVSDDRAKLAAAWDQGHAAGIANVEKALRRSPQELRAQEGYAPADTARFALAKGWDEGREAMDPQVKLALARGRGEGREQMNNIQVEKDRRDAAIHGPALVMKPRGEGTLDKTRASLQAAEETAKATRDAETQALPPAEQAARRTQDSMVARVRNRPQLERVEERPLLQRAGDAVESAAITPAAWLSDKFGSLSDKRAKTDMQRADDMIGGMRKNVERGPSTRDRDMERADDMIAGMKRGLESGPSVRDDQEPPAWLRGYMHDDGIRSDERAKQVRRAEEPMAEANRAQQGYEYAYKDQFRPSSQAPGEKNVGPMAQNLASDPLARTAVKQAPNGLLMLDRDKLAKLHSAGIASLQEQVDEQDRVISNLSRVLKKRSA